MGFVVLGAVVLYVWFSSGVILLVGHAAKENGNNPVRWGCGAALVMFLIPFWDWLPTVAVHQYYCATEAGFWVYKTLDQWKAENPGVFETLVRSKPNVQRYGNDENHTDIQILNQRMQWATEKKHLNLTIYQWKHELVDTKNNEVIARQVNFSSDPGQFSSDPKRGSLKFWLNNQYCPDGESESIEMHRFANTFKEMKK